MTTMTTEERLGRLEAGQAGIYERLGRLEAGQAAINQRLDDTNARISDTNTRITDTNTRQMETNSRLDKVIFTLFGIGAGVIATLVTAIFTPANQHLIAQSRPGKDVAKQKGQVLSLPLHCRSGLPASRATALTDA